MNSMEWLATTGLTVFVAAGTGALVWLIMHLHLQLAVLRERESHWLARLPPPPAETQPTVSEQWLEARMANLLFRLTEHPLPALPAPEPEPAIEVEVSAPTSHRRRLKPSKPAPKRAKRPVSKSC